MKGNAKLLSFILWISSSLVCTLGTTSTDDYYYYNPGTDYPLWCIFCRSDKNNACINNVESNQDKFTKPCINETLVEFYKDLKLNPPDRPVIAPRAYGKEHKWGCYRLYTLDQTFTLRTCQRTDHAGAEERCKTCAFRGVKARCCICNTPNCNFKNSDAIRIVYEQPIIILTFVIHCIRLIFI